MTENRTLTETKSELVEAKKQLKDKAAKIKRNIELGDEE